MYYVPFLFLLSWGIPFFSWHQYKFTATADVDMPVYTEIEAFGEKLAKSHGMELKFVCNATYDHTVRYGLLFNTSQKMTLEEGRKVAKEIMDQWWPMLRSNEAIRTYSHNMMKRFKWYEDLSIKHVSFRIDFWDKNIDRILPPHLGQIMAVGKTFYYYEADPETLELKLVYQEEYQD